MHIPDGYLDAWVFVLFYVLSAIVLFFALRRSKDILQERQVPLLGVLAAAIFAAQMLNWPIPGGTSAHFVGGALAAIFLGPYAGALAMTVVLVIQCLLFGDGGITALGANVWNMAIVDCFIGYYVYKSIASRVSGDGGKIFGAFFGGWLGITAAAAFAGIEIGISSAFRYGIGVTVPVMAGWHAALGIIEGVITAAVVAYTLRVRADLFASALELTTATEGGV